MEIINIIMTKNKNKRINVVYSTDPDFEYSYDEPKEKETLEPNYQNLKIYIDKKNRNGKAVTLITDFVGHSEDLNILARNIKSFCGVGGAVKNNEILIQGDQRKRINTYLLGKGYRTRLV